VLKKNILIENYSLRSCENQAMNLYHETRLQYIQTRASHQRGKPNSSASVIIHQNSRIQDRFCSTWCCITNSFQIVQF